MRNGVAFINKVLTETGSAEKEAIDALKARAAERKVALERGLGGLRFQVKTVKAALENEPPRMERIALECRCSNTKSVYAAL